MSVYQLIDRLEHDRNEQAKDIAKLRKSVHRLGGIVEKLRKAKNETHVITTQRCGPDCPACTANRDADLPEQAQCFLSLKDFDKAMGIISELLDKYGPSWSSGPREIGIKLREVLHILGVNDV